MLIPFLVILVLPLPQQAVDVPRLPIAEHGSQVTEVAHVYNLWRTRVTGVLG